MSYFKSYDNKSYDWETWHQLNTKFQKHDTIKYHVSKPRHQLNSSNHPQSSHENLATKVPCI